MCLGKGGRIWQVRCEAGVSENYLHDIVKGEAVALGEAVLATQLMNVSSIPPGIPRTKATLEVVLASREAGYDELLSQAEIELIGCYLEGRNYGKALEAFSSTLTRLLHRPELYEARQLDLLSRFYPRVIAGACKQPDVPLSLVNHLLVGLEALQETLEPSTAATEYLRHNLREPLGFPATERRFLDQAIDRITAEDSRSLGRAIDITQVELAMERSPEKALQVAWRMLTHEMPATQKARLLRVILPGLVQQKSWQVAWEAHLLAYEFDREHSQLSELSEHFRFLAVTGRWQRLVAVLERHLPMIRQADNPWDLLVGLRNIVAALDSLEFHGYGHQVLRVSLAAATRFHDLPPLIRPTIREVRDSLGAAAAALAQRFDERNGTVEVSSSLGLLDYQPFPDGLYLQGGEDDVRFLSRLLRARALLECEQGFEALLVLGGLEQTKYPSTQRLRGEIHMLTSLARMQMNHDAADQAEAKHLESLVFGDEEENVA